MTEITVIVEGSTQRTAEARAMARATGHGYFVTRIVSAIAVRAVQRENEDLSWSWKVTMEGSKADVFDGEGTLIPEGEARAWHGDR